MSGREDVALNTFVIPSNFGDTGRCINGLFRTRNLIEAVILALPALILITNAEGINIDQKIILIILIAGSLFAIGVHGIAGDSLTEYLQNIFIFLRAKRVAKYNPRIKFEATPGYLTKELSELPRDKILRLIGNITKKINESEEAVSEDIYNPAYIEFFDDDIDVVEMPDDLKDRRQLKRERKERKKLEKIRKKARTRTIRELRKLAGQRGWDVDAYIESQKDAITAAEEDAVEEYKTSKKE